MYVFGLASPEEAKEVEEVATEFPEVRQELASIRGRLDRYIRAHAVQPPESLKNLILQRVEGNAKPKHKPTPQPEKTKPAEPAAFQLEKKRSGINLGAIAAVLFGLLFLGALYKAWEYWQQIEEAKMETQTLEAQFDDYKKESQARQTKDAELLEQFVAIRHWATRTVQLKGTKLSEEALAVVYWNDVKQSAFLDLINLPEPESNKEYQLWAVVGKNLVSLGVFDLNSQSGKLKPVQFVKDATGFFISQEPKGGSEQPAPDQVFATGSMKK